MSNLEPNGQYTFVFLDESSCEEPADEQVVSNIVSFSDTLLRRERLEAVERLKRNRVFDTSRFECLLSEH